MAIADIVVTQDLADLAAIVVPRVIHWFWKVATADLAVIQDLADLAVSVASVGNRELRCLGATAALAAGVAGVDLAERRELL